MQQEVISIRWVSLRIQIQFFTLEDQAVCRQLLVKDAQRLGNGCGSRCVVAGDHTHLPFSVSDVHMKRREGEIEMRGLTYPNSSFVTDTDGILHLPPGGVNKSNHSNKR